MSQLQVTGEAKIRDIQGPVVANDGVVTALDGAASQYVRGDGTLADFPTSSGGGSSVSYYLNSSVSQGTIGGVAYRELSKEPIIGAGTDIAISANGYVASYLTDANDPDVTIVPGGNFNCEFYFSVNNNTGNPTTYAELYKYDGTTFTLLGSNVGVPESINQGTTIAPYYFAIPVATASLAITDRLAIRIYVNVDGRTVTLHTENGHLCQVVTTLSKGMVSLNNLTDQSQYLTTGTSGTNFAIVSSGDTHTFNIPSASATNRGLITTGTQTIAGSKTFSSTTLLNSVYIDGLSYLKHQASSGGGIAGYTIFNALTNGVLEYIFPTLFKSVLDFNDGADYTYTFPDLSGTLALLEGAQTFTGGKTFSALTAFTFANGTRMDYGLYFSKGSVPSAFSGSTTNIYSDSTTNNIVIRDNSSIAKLEFNNSTQTYTFPSVSGTIALLEGSQTFTGNKRFDTGVLIKNGVSPSASGYTGIGAGTSGLTVNLGSGGGGYLIFQSTSYDYTFPTASGTIALTSQLPTYGNLTSADSGSMTITGGTGAVIGSGTSITLLNASATNAGIVSTGTQTFAGAKTFSLDILVNSVKIGNANGSNLNTVVGFGALTGTGVENTAVGYLTLSNNTTGNSNTAVGKRSLLNNTSATWNTAIGAESLFSNTTGVANVAIGYYSLFANTTGFSNVSVGYNSMTTSNGNENTAIGNQSMQLNTNGVSNTAIGHTALQNNTTGNNNIGIGYESGRLITTGNYNTIIGSYAGTTSMSNNIVLADGQGNIRYQWNGTNNVFTGAATFTSSVTSTLGYSNTSDLGFVASANIAGINLRSTGGGRLSIVTGYIGADISSILVGTGTNNPTTESIRFNHSANSINVFGAATFSSSVRAVNLGLGFAPQSGITAFVYDNSAGYNMVIQQDGSGIPFQITSGGSVRMIVTNGGNVLIGTTSAGTDFSRMAAPTASQNVFGLVSTDNSSGAAFIAFRKADTGAIGSISRVGTTDAVSFNTTSDYRLKEDLQEIKGLEKVSAIKVYDFKWKDNDARMDGVIAHELQEIIPYAVTGEKDAEEMQSVDYSKIVPILVKAIQELKQEIEILKNK